ncbi:hypothetical protein CBM2592_A110080 [Cupriavidus taiwanensis]|nr:hypothetical protein CBM2592_A110080 [Cupriavidus taiwanensis]SOY58888.1 hypothetical protein CBM2588_A80086 [Cupriavidus taiwanensis]SOY80121.1 hypothetical protein CBM2591_A130004 [Cupriavidus taiwanensis]SOZ50920.1 hypothetical protein CBM2617_A110080 [Cupriavidus taiwanensis]SOZ76019.1 hypothetical protein CBM2622_A110078 [Cupriavidus taiwanensis]
MGLTKINAALRGGGGLIRRRVQVLLTTHSSQLAASAELETMTMIVGNRAFPPGRSHTRLEPDDYDFLRRFLDATKADLFFARALPPIRPMVFMFAAPAGAPTRLPPVATLSNGSAVDLLSLAARYRFGNDLDYATIEPGFDRVIELVGEDVARAIEKGWISAAKTIALGPAQRGTRGSIAAASRRTDGAGRHRSHARDGSARNPGFAVPRP